VYKR
jgi:hypothetical protein